MHFGQFSPQGQHKFSRRKLLNLKPLEYFEPTQKIKYIDQGRSKHRDSRSGFADGEATLELSQTASMTMPNLLGVWSVFHRSLSSGGLLFLPVEARIGLHRTVGGVYSSESRPEMAELRIQKAKCFSARLANVSAEFAKRQRHR